MSIERDRLWRGYGLTRDQRTVSDWYALRDSPEFAFLPKRLFKFQKCEDNRIRTLAAKKIWFSYPKEFEDLLDFTVRTDIETAAEEYKKNPESVISRIVRNLIIAFAEQRKKQIDLDAVDKTLDKITIEDYQNIDCIDEILKLLIPHEDLETRLGIKALSSQIVDEIKTYLENVLSTWIKANTTMREQVLVCCFSETCDDGALWEHFCGEDGFCIEYEIKPTSTWGQDYLVCLTPIYYGERPIIKLTDVLANGMKDPMSYRGICPEDWVKFYFSHCIKGESFSYQREWRILLGDFPGRHSFPFPFAKSLILGSKISEENERRLISIAKTQNLIVYKRRLTIDGSDVVNDQIFPQKEDN